MSSLENEVIKLNGKNNLDVSTECQEPHSTFDEGMNMFDIARIIGRVENMLQVITKDVLFALSEDQLSKLTHEILYIKIQAIYEELKDIEDEFTNL